LPPPAKSKYITRDKVSQPRRSARHGYGGVWLFWQWRSKSP